MGVGVRALVVVAAAALAAGGAQAAKPKRNANPSFRVTVTSTFLRHHVVHVSRAGDPGCSLRTDSDATQRVVAATAAPVVVTLRQLLHGIKPFVGLRARETRRGSFRYGYQDGCPNTATNPPYFSDTSGCNRARPGYILAGNVALGYVNRTNRFRFTYTRTGGDAFSGSCLADVFVGENENAPGSESVSMPPPQWLAGKTARRWWTALAPARLRAGKKVVVRWKDSATFAMPPAGDPALYDEYVHTDAYSVSWTVTLTPLASARR